ncbi:hypothetical protein [Brevibacterium moorei]|uniref:hypothetical protein n=1 Tax=Brevibacterium moorei TaxID=2968457 RepID=UPI00211CC203|nr:hypothetical protein [Brevibacterium sp. 68QC2CO]MCQ9385099.1 hypothetical protein [Brevibacterium sp. 68QC2CO]
MSFNPEAFEKALNDAPRRGMHPIDALLLDLDGDDRTFVEMILRDKTVYTAGAVADALTAAGARGIGRQQVKSWRERECR